MEQPSVLWRPIELSELTESRASKKPSSPSPLPQLSKLGTEPRTLRILDFDIETIAAGFADPNWVPQKVTCVAWSWVGSDRVESRISGMRGLFHKPAERARMLTFLLEQIKKADIVTGHNIARFDLPVINADAMRLGLEPIRSVVVQDTMRLVKAKGFKKGQDVLGHLYKTREEKLALDWQEWQDAYAEKGWDTVRRRCESDVVAHKQLRVELMERGLLKPPSRWSA